MSLLVGSVFLFLSPLLSLGSSDRSHNVDASAGIFFSTRGACLPVIAPGWPPLTWRLAWPLLLVMVFIRISLG